MTVVVAVLAAARAMGPIVGSSSLEAWHPLPSSPRGLHRYRPQTVKHTTPQPTWNPDTDSIRHLLPGRRALNARELSIETNRRPRTEKIDMSALRSARHIAQPRITMAAM